MQGAQQQSFSNRAPFPWVALLVALAVMGALWLTFFVAPREAEMGEVQRIFYFHVASAFTALLGWVGCALLSVVFLLLSSRPEQRFLALTVDRLAHGFAEVGVLFGIIVLVTGPFWAKPVWGTYWTWEPRLVLMMLTTFLFIGYLVLRAYAQRDEAGRKLAAGLAVIGGPAVYLIHVAVELWGGNHPIVVAGDGLQNSDMKLAFSGSVIAVMLLAGYFIALRLQHEKSLDALEESFLELADHEDLL